jgi:CheY-like chemotaxis protein
VRTITAFESRARSEVVEALHHLNNALAGILSYSEFAAEELARAEAEDPARWGGAVRDVQAITAAGHRAAALARQLLALERGETATISPDGASAVVTPETVAAHSSEAPGDGRAVLVVDDDADICRLVHRILVGAGFAVITAPDAASALTVASVRPGEIDVVLADVAMPGMRVTALIEQLQVLQPGIEVVLMSGHFPREVETVRSDHHSLDKPFSSGSLVHTIADALDGP